MSETSWGALERAHLAAHHGATGDLPTHAPKAAVLACSDARVPPSVLFDQPAGSLFVVRIAGNTAPSSALASLDYAVDQLGVDLIVVLGHTGCGAVAAAASGTCGGYLAPIVEPICDIARLWPDGDPDSIGERNVANTVHVLRTHDGPIGDAVREGRLEIRGAVHDLRTGRLVPVEDPDLVAAGSRPATSPTTDSTTTNPSNTNTNTNPTAITSETP